MRLVVVVVMVVLVWLLVAVCGGGKVERDKAFPCWSTPVKPYLLTHTCFTADGATCRCSTRTLDCSSNWGNLTYIPWVFQDVQVVNFSNNGLTNLTDDHFFENVSRSVWLVDLFNNDMIYLTPAVFRPLPRLRSVLIGGNRLSYEALTPVLAIPTLNVLDIKCGHLGIIPQGYFANNSAINLEHLDMSWNNVDPLDMHSLQPLKRLRIYVLWHNKLSSLTTAYLPSVESLSFHHNRLFDFPVTCKEGTNDSLFPNLTGLILTYNMISSIPDPLCLPRLENLQLDYNWIKYLTSYMFSVTRFPALKYLGLGQMEIKNREINGYVFNNSKLEFINFGFNLIDFSSTFVSADMFAGCTGLKGAYLSHNTFKTVSKEKLHRIFQCMPNVETLYLSTVQLTTISSDTFTHLPKLKSLYLYENSLVTLPDGAFDQLSSLQHLYLASNLISVISSDTFSEQTQFRLVNLDLSENPFVCSCEIVWFQTWLRRQPAIFLDSKDGHYMCANLHNTTVQHFYVRPQACLLSKSTSILIISFTCFALLLLTVSIVVFGYRWHIRLWLYALCRGRHERRRRHEDRLLRRFQYDVFMAYAEEDVGWVLDELLPVLEGQWGLRMCVHQRDFIPGKHIVDNISDCVDTSDRILMVFSPHFAYSQWCQFELKYCQTLLMERDDVMIIVMLQETETRDMSGAMLAMLRTTTYIEWEDEHRVRESFWGRLALALGDVLPPNH